MGFQSLSIFSRREHVPRWQPMTPAAVVTRTILDDIVAKKREEIVRHRSERPLALLRDRSAYHAPRRGFRAALARGERAIIAEVKKASPSKGVIRADFDAVAIAKAYAANGARCLSILTDEPFFQGRLEFLEAARAAVSIPCLRKDFTIDAYQVEEARAFGADAVLLIVAILDDAELRELAAAAREAELDVLVEVHSEDELERAVAARADLVGINNRDLRTFVTRLEVSESLAPRLPRGTTVVAESGLRTTADLERLERSGVHAFLIGESLMAAPDPGVALAELLRR